MSSGGGSRDGLERGLVQGLSCRADIVVLVHGIRMLSAGVKHLLLRKRLERRGVINSSETWLKYGSGLLLLSTHIPCIDSENKGLNMGDSSCDRAVTECTQKVEAH